MIERVGKAIAEVVDRKTSGDYDIDGEIAEECARAALKAIRDVAFLVGWKAVIDAALSPSRSHTTKE